MQTPIKDYNGRILGFIEYDPNSKIKTAKNYYGTILGRYDEKLNRTTDYYGRIVAEGDVLSSLIMDDARGKR